jgi:uncharacterized phage-associated protein
MNLVFDELKATQTAAHFLRLAGGSLNYLLLIKLLYGTDREAIKRWGLPVTTDKYSAMKLGPVTSAIYDRIKASSNPKAHASLWSSHIQKSDNPMLVKLTCDPGDSELSRAEEKLIDEIFATHGAKNPFDLASEYHRDFPEWKDPGTSSTPIEITDIIEALGLSEDEANGVATLIDVQRAAYMLSI